MKLLWKVINIYTCAYTYIFIHVHIHIFVYTCIDMYKCVCVSLSLFLRAVAVAAAGCCGCCVVVEKGGGGEREETNRTMSQLTSSAVSLRIAETEQLYQAQRMIGGIGNVLLSTYSQTENG